MYPEAFTLLDLAEQHRRDLLAEAARWRRGGSARRLAGLHRRSTWTRSSGGTTSGSRAA